MIPSDRRPGNEPSPAGQEGTPQSARGTLPPPEWTPPGRRASSTTLAPQPLERRTGRRAEEAWLRARVEQARAAGDAGATRQACVDLARWLASRDRDLDEAVELAVQALLAGPEVRREPHEDVELRREVAAWLESLGEASRAAAALRPIAAMPEVDSAEAAYVLVRTGVLKARAGAAAGAAAAFEAALPIDPDDPLPGELLGAVSEWEAEAVSPAAAAEAYVEAARRRAAQGHDEGELEDLWRAFASDPGSGRAVQALVEALEQRGRPDPADEAWRAHARAIVERDPERAAVVHARRRTRAIAAQATSRALAAALDEGLDARFAGEGSEAFDALLLDLGLLESLAARALARSAAVAEPAARAACLVELAKLYAGPLADDTRAAAAYRAALSADPDCSEAVAALRRLLEPPGAALELVDDGGESRVASAAAWARAVACGDVRALAAALERVAASTEPVLRAVLLSTAADRWLAAGDLRAARRAGELALQADPQSARCVATLADVMARGDRDRSAAAALERAVALVGPRRLWCAALADALDALGETELAVGWSQRAVALRPGDRAAIEQLLARIVRSGDGGRLGDTLAWLLSQPQPLAWLAGPFAGALRELARVDVDRAAVVARRTLDVLGPRSTLPREAMLEVADRASDGSFAAAVLERWIASGAEGTERQAILVRLADLRERLADDEGEARIVARAAQEGVPGPEIDRHLERLVARPMGPDGELWRLRALAERPGAEAAPAEVARAWRELGAALWDMADDRMGAIAAWQRAAHLAPSRGHATLALDLVAFAGAEFAFEYLARVVETEPDDANAASIAADVARAALSTGEPSLAFDLAARGVARSPACAAALEAAERAVERTQETAALSGLYELVASRALGRFGRRAAHYRGARYFERRGEYALALKHAAQAFYSVPSEGSAFHLLARAAERAGDRTQAVRTIEQVADGTTQSAVRAAWLLRAASIAGDGEEGARRKVDVLLRAAVASPVVATIGLLRDSARELLRFGPEEREVLEIRLGRAAHAITERLVGPDGARIAVAFATTALELFGDGDGAFASLERAFASDADVDEFDDLVARAPSLALARDARARVAKLLDAVEQPHANAGVPALRLLGAVGAALGDESLRGRAAVAAALREPDQNSLVIEADAAVRRVPALAERLGKRVDAQRRGQALLAVARAHVSEGAHIDAAPLFERAIELVEGDERAEVERELRAAWDAAGRGSEIEARVQREAASSGASPGMRADRWTEIAERREARGDKKAAVRALLEACKLDPQPMHRWSALERVAEIAGDDEARVAALEEIAARVGDDGRVPVFKRLARAHERRGDLDSAVAAWGRVLTLDPEDEEADHAVESLIVARGRYDELVDHLARRAERLSAHSGTREMLRAVRLRRAAILEQRLGRIGDACDELALLLGEWPDNAGALRYLADLLDRQGEPARAAPLWRRAAAVEEDPAENDALELRAGRASLAAGDLAAALDHANRVLARNPADPSALELRVDVARALGADAELGDALEAIAARPQVDPRTRSDLLLEAAQAAARRGDAASALDRARRASTAARERATPQLLARGLEYRLRGAGAPDEARHTIEELTRIREPLGPDDEALRAFLLAEALDVVQGGGAGLQELEAARTIVGDHPLVALGLAERLAAQGQHRRAVDAYRIALSGTLLDLRRLGAVALAAADAALRCARLQEAAAFLDLAERHEDVREAAAARRGTLARLDAAARRVTLAPGDPDAPIADASHVAAPRPPPHDPRLDALEAAVRSATTPHERARARLALGRARLERDDARGAEPLLWEALADGLTAAGDALAPLLASSPDRARDLVRVRRQQVSLEPGDMGRLESLRDAALADEDRVYARAVEHVLRAFDAGAGPLPPPPLHAQPEQPGIFALLARPSMDAAGEALALLWEGAMQLFVRDAASYGITGVERVVPGPSSAIARLYEAAMRVLDAPRIPLFVPRASAGTPVSHVALLAPPSVILAGDVREETTEARFALGRGMSAALPHNVLRLGLAPAEGRALVDAMRAAFGPPELGRRLDSRAARLAESFWQIVPARTQRRLQELLGTTTVAEYEELLARAHQSGRRVGMFLAGDFASAARQLLAESGFHVDEPPSLATLRPLCEQVPALADLLRLAVSPEYASARWHVVAPNAPRGTISSGRFSLF
jgi:tetratricopeptide (TPR) repeat protein